MREMAVRTTNITYCVKADGFHGELFRPKKDRYPGKALICFGGSDGRFELSRMLAHVFQAQGLTALALAYVMEEGLPKQFCRVPIDPLEAAAKRLHREHLPERMLRIRRKSYGILRKRRRVLHTAAI